MLFLIQYDRRSGRLLSMKTFNDVQLDEAQDARLNLELELGERALDDEVILLEAESEAALLETHARYFKPIESMGK